MITSVSVILYNISTPYLRFIHKGENTPATAGVLHAPYHMLDNHHDDNAVVLHVDMQVCHATSVDVAIKYIMCSIHV